MEKKKNKLTTKEIRESIKNAHYELRNNTIYLSEQDNWSKETEQEWLLAYHNEKDLRMKKEIRDHIIMQFYRLVQKEAYKLYNKYRTQSDPVPLEDLCQAGSYGLCVALDKYDISHKKNARFMTYAGDFIRGYMRHLIRDHKIRHLSGTRGVLENHIKKFNEQIAQGEEHKIDNRELLNIQNPLSFDCQSNTDDHNDSELYEIYQTQDPKNKDPFFQIEQQEFLSFLQEGLTEERLWVLREIRIKGLTYAELAEKSGMKKSRLIQIMKDTTEHMRKRLEIWQKLTENDESEY